MLGRESGGGVPVGAEPGFTGPRGSCQPVVVDEEDELEPELCLVDFSQAPGAAERRGAGHVDGRTDACNR